MIVVHQDLRLAVESDKLRRGIAAPSCRGAPQGRARFGFESQQVVVPFSAAIYDHQIARDERRARQAPAGNRDAGLALQIELPERLAGRGIETAQEAGST